MKLDSKSVENGMPVLTITGQHDSDFALMTQFVNQKLVAVDASVNGYRRLKIMPDLSSVGKPDKGEKLKNKSLDDLLDMAARRGYEDIPRDVLRQDLEALLVMHDEDPEEAKSLRKMVRRSPKVAAKVVETSPQSVGGGVAKFKTMNEVDSL